MKRKIIKYDEVRWNDEDETLDILYKGKTLVDFNPEGLVEHWLAFRNSMSADEYKRV